MLARECVAAGRNVTKVRRVSAWVFSLADLVVVGPLVVVDDEGPGMVVEVGASARGVETVVHLAPARGVVGGDHAAGGDAVVSGAEAGVPERLGRGPALGDANDRLELARLAGVVSAKVEVIGVRQQRWLWRRRGRR